MAIRRAGQIVLCRFPRTDLAAGKRRPALLIRPLPAEFDDWLVCMLSTKAEHAVPGVDEMIGIADSDFERTGLKENTIIRLTRLATVNDSLFTGTIGGIDSERLGRLRNNLARWIQEDD